jgi:DNA-binding NarL/FixJ family response regulator
MSGRLLLVSKDPLALAGISNAVRLRLPDVLVETASSADRAIILVATSDYDVVVFPSSMPDMHAVDFLGEVKSLRPETLAFVAGDPADDHLRTEALRHGAEGYIDQPIVIDRFIPIVQKAIYDRHSQPV